MAKLVILNQGLSGQTYDLKVGRTTIGRVDDNSFEIPDPSVSSHHCEIHWRAADANEVFFRDLGSTNGSFIDGERISEAVLKPGQALRLGYVEISFVGENMPMPAIAPAPAAEAAAPAPAPSPTAPPPPPPKPAAPLPAAEPLKKTADGTLVIPRGVSMTDLEQGGSRGGGFNNNTTVFAKKKKNPNKMFVIGGIVIGVIIVVLIIVSLVVINSGHH